MIRRTAYWRPDGPLGFTWSFVSFRGRPLGKVTKVIKRYEAYKTCCATPRYFNTLGAAASYVQTSLYCTECKLSCLVPKSN